jgi:hypothetical protein
MGFNGLNIDASLSGLNGMMGVSFLGGHQTVAAGNPHNKSRDSSAYNSDNSVNNSRESSKYNLTNGKAPNAWSLLAAGASSDDAASKKGQKKSGKGQQKGQGKKAAGKKGIEVVNFIGHGLCHTLYRVHADILSLAS